MHYPQIISIDRLHLSGKRRRILSIGLWLSIGL
jgi:hypothetical protein